MIKENKTFNESERAMVLKKSKRYRFDSMIKYNNQNAVDFK